MAFAMCVRVHACALCLCGVGAHACVFCFPSCSHVGAHPDADLRRTLEQPLVSGWGKLSFWKAWFTSGGPGPWMLPGARPDDRLGSIVRSDPGPKNQSE